MYVHNVLVKALAAGSTSQSLLTAGCLASSSYLFIEIPSNMFCSDLYVFCSSLLILHCRAPCTCIHENVKGAHFFHSI